MAFTPEDGTGVTDANSYCNVAYADAYHSDRGNAAWASATTQNKQAALVKATDYIDQTYRFLGEPANDGQALSWPREADGFDEDEIPTRLKQAVCILALTALTEALNPDIAPGSSVKSKRVDVLEVEYFESAVKRTVRPAIDGLMKALTGGAGWNVPVVRV